MNDWSLELVCSAKGQFLLGPKVIGTAMPIELLPMKLPLKYVHSEVPLQTKFLSESILLDDLRCFSVCSIPT